MQALGFISLAALAATLTGQPAKAPAYRDPDLPAAQRAADLVGRMTLEEKVLQMQDQAPAIARLGVPAYGWWNEALHGVARAGQATVFPQAIGIAATWDTGLMHRIGDIISTEARAKYNEAIRRDIHARYSGLTFWSPNINIFRDPRWGRGQETYGEDPFLTGRMAVAFITGMQGDDAHYFKVVSTAKHYAVHSGPEPDRHRFDVHPSERDLNETYLPAFRAAVKDGKVDSIMCAYNSVNGLPACANTDLLQKDLKAWGFQGYVVSDCGAIGDFFSPTGHKYSPSAAAASATAVKAGTDLTCGGEYARGLPEAVKSGLIQEAELDQALVRLFVARIKLGMFDPPERVPFNKIPITEADSAEHRQVALEAARKAIVLLKNDNRALPLKPSVRKIAVIGPAADDPVALLGNYNGFSQRQVTPLEGVERQFAGKAEVRFAMGSPYVPGMQALVPSTVLTPPSGPGHGLLAEYFDNPDFAGTPKMRRVEARIFQQAELVDTAVAAVIPTPAPAQAPAAPGGVRVYMVPAPTASVRWTGTLTAPVTGQYQIAGRGGRGPGALRIFLDDKELLAPAAAGQPGGAGRGAASPLVVQLEAGHAYRLRVDYKGNGPAFGAQLLWLPPADALLGEAVEAVKNADVAVAFAGLNPNLEGEEMPIDQAGFLGGDRTEITLPETQERLVKAAIATGKPVVVVLVSGSALAANYAAEHAAAVLELWYGGEESGTAIAETLAGINNPGGRLPVTFYKGVDQLPKFDDYAMEGRTYRYFHGEPLYGFGFGMSYSTFQYSGLKAQRTAAGARISVRVKNTAGPAGDEVVQLYVNGGGAPGDAIRQLRAFERVHLRPGESREVQFTLAGEDVPRNKVRIGVGGGQPAGKIPHLETTL
jgi:beta-glucosidase